MSTKCLAKSYLTPDRGFAYGRLMFKVSCEIVRRENGRVLLHIKFTRPLKVRKLGAPIVIRKARKTRSRDGAHQLWTGSISNRCKWSPDWNN